LHKEIGEYARGRCDLLFAIGDLASEAAAAFGTDGRRLADIAAARDALESLLGKDVTVLVKGSRVMGLDRLVKTLEIESARAT
ncbi:MAG TPA: UDP-N-acetylmuramoyl-tripeptide--D-alanyl-D-alanine ligase, partial [Gammaproteobacteria bacterium]